VLFAVQVTHLELVGHLAVTSMSLLKFDTESNRYAELQHFIYQSDVSLSLSPSLSVITSLNKTLFFVCVIIISTLRFSCKRKTTGNGPSTIG